MAVKEFFLMVLISLAVCGNAHLAFADQCATGKDGKEVCAPPGGNALVDERGEVTVVKGKCVLDRYRVTMCSDIPKGTATLNKVGLAVCDGGCVVGALNSKQSEEGL